MSPSQQYKGTYLAGGLALSFFIYRCTPDGKGTVAFVCSPTPVLVPYIVYIIMSVSTAEILALTVAETVCSHCFAVNLCGLS